MTDSTKDPGLVHVGLPVNVERYETVEPFGGYRDLIVLQVVRGELRTPVFGEPVTNWLRRAANDWLAS